MNLNEASKFMDEHGTTSTLNSMPCKKSINSKDKDTSEQDEYGNSMLSTQRHRTEKSVDKRSARKQFSNRKAKDRPSSAKNRSLQLELILKKRSLILSSGP